MGTVAHQEPIEVIVVHVDDQLSRLNEPRRDKDTARVGHLRKIQVFPPQEDRGAW